MTLLKKHILMQLLM